MDGSFEKDENDVRLELKYCEHCGGLWLRECGAGVVYCPSCQPKVAELPIPKKKPHRVNLPVGKRAWVESYKVVRGKPGEEGLEAIGGVAWAR